VLWSGTGSSDGVWGAEGYSRGRLSVLSPQPSDSASLQPSAGFLIEVLYSGCFSSVRIWRWPSREVLVVLTMLLSHFGPPPRLTVSERRLCT
jgi:hypothetical protein